MKISYFPGCTLKTMAKNFEDSALASMSSLGIEMVELRRWNCCGTVYCLTSDDLIHQVAPVRNLIRVKEQKNNWHSAWCSHKSWPKIIAKEVAKRKIHTTNK